MTVEQLEGLKTEAQKRDPMIDTWTYDLEPTLVEWKKDGLYEGPTNLVHSVWKVGGAARQLNDPFWDSEVSVEYNVEAGHLFTANGVLQVFSATADIKKGAFL